MISQKARINNYKTTNWSHAWIHQISSLNYWAGSVPGPELRTHPIRIKSFIFRNFNYWLIISAYSSAVTHLTKTPPRDTPDIQSASGDLISARRVHQEAITPGDPRVKETTSATGFKNLRVCQVLVQKQNLFPGAFLASRLGLVKY